MNQKIRKTANNILELQESIYTHINTNRYQANLISDPKVWNQICSSLDVISDTIMAILSYCSNNYPKDIGLQYIYTYGLLQSLFIQQDAVKNLTKAFGQEYQISEPLKKSVTLEMQQLVIPHTNRQKKIPITPTCPEIRYLKKFFLHEV